MDTLEQEPSQFEFATFSLKIDEQPPASTKGPFLFIVKTPDSDKLSRSTTRSAAACINSHAQRWAQEVAASPSSYEADARRKTETPAFEKCMTRCRIFRFPKDPSKSGNGKRSNAGNKIGRTSEKGSIRTTPQPSEKLCTSNSDKDSSMSAETDPMPRSHFSKGGTVDSPRRSPLPSPSRPISSQLDPFKSTAFAIDSDVQPILQYYLSFALQSTAKGDDSQSTPNGTVAQHFASINAIVQGCMHRTVHMYALLAATSSRMRRVLGVTFRVDKGPEIYLHKALQCLRILLDTNSHSAIEDRQIILDIYLLSVCGWYMENYGESKTHFNVLKHFWKTLTPGQSTLDQYIYDLLSYNTSFLEADAAKVSPRDGSASASASRAAERCTNDTPWAWPPKGAGHCSALPLALEQAAYSLELKEIARELPRLLHLSTHPAQTSDLKGAETDWGRSTSTALVVRLLDVPSYGGELCCRLTLVIFLRQMFRPGCPSSTTSSSACDTDTEFPFNIVLATQRLRRGLQYEILLPSNEISPVTLANNATATSHSNQSHAQQQHIWTGKSNPLLLWILLTGLFGARLTQQTDEYQWFWARAKPLMRLLEISTVAQLRRLMMSFVFVEAMLEDQSIEGILVDARHDQE